jgi:hypothetical protein
MVFSGRPLRLQLTFRDRLLLHDPATYGSDTDLFLPERFLTPGMKAPTVGFGFGRRQGFIVFYIQVSEQNGKNMPRSTLCG